MNLEKPSLSNVLAYENENVIYRFIDNFDLSKEEALDIFYETKKWLWLCAMRKYDKNAPSMVIDNSLLIIDEMWHNFILFTKDYSEFCKKHFSFYIHHAPTTKEEKENFKKDKQEVTFRYRDRTEEQYNYIYDMLGEDTLTKWFEEYPEKYSKKNISKVSRLYA